MDAATEEKPEKKLASIVLGEGEEEQDDEFLEVINLLRIIHECRKQAKQSGKTIRIAISLIDA